MLDITRAAEKESVRDPKSWRPKLTIRLFPPRVDAEGIEAIQALVKPSVLLPITAAMIFLASSVLLVSGGRTAALLTYLFSRWFSSM